ncbi:hypothetical protein Cfor_10698 [Coptotermes formosanus]|uniref:Ionotropic glutamate receptor C-terminal domain-containing protein n=1 Tax=Coptotermes formosanus TaxID=36987 RepID=A0A6L2P8E7_COPFO|nr:hypothetical protein Cfor_10698 [Coptotermes formosanus]
MSVWTVALVFVITFFLTQQYKLQSSEFVQLFNIDERAVSFSDNKAFWRVCSQYFIINRLTLAVTLQTNTYTVSDISSVLLQQMHNHLATPLTIMEHKASLVKPHPKKHISLRQILNNKSTNEFDSRHQHGTPTDLPKDRCVHHVYRLRKGGTTGMDASPYRRKSNVVADEYDAEHKTREEAMRTAKHTSTQHTANSRNKQALQKADLTICSYPFAEHNNSLKDISRCYQPILPLATHFHIMQNTHSSCANYLIIAENENSVIGYFTYLTKININWNSKIKFIILLYVQFGYDSTNEYKVRCRTLLQKLWEEFKVIDVILMAVSVIQNRYVVSENVIVYNPFLPTHESLQRGRIFNLNGSAITSRNSIPKFYGYPLRVVTFRRFPTVLSRAECYLDDKTCTITYTGMDASLLYSLAAYLNFTPIIRHTSDGEEYGYGTQNGTFTGAIGDIVHGRADISMNGVFIKVYGSDKIVFTHSAYSDKVCIIVPKANRVPKWLTIFRPVDSTVALSVLGLYIINVCFYFLINQARSSFESNLSKSKIGWSIILTEMFRPFVASSFPRIPSAISQRIFLISCLLFGLVLTSAMQSMLVTAMTKPYYYPDINTLEELDASGLSIYTGSPSLIDTFGSDQINSTVTSFDINPTMDRLSRRVKVAASRINLWRLVSTERNIAILVRKTDYADGAVLDKYRASDGSLLLHALRECPRHYFLGYLMPRGSPYLPYINKGIARLVEAGIVEHWKHITPPSADMYDGRHDPTNLTEIPEINNGNPKVFSLKDLQLAFYILAVGLSGSVIIFLLELIAMKKKS